MQHAGFGGPHLDRGRKRFVDRHWTRAEVALTLGFLVVLVLTVILGMYLGWWSARAEEVEEKAASPNSPISQSAK
jgi:hypothetical protein